MRAPGVARGLLARFLLTLGPAFLLVAVPASLGVLGLLQRSAEDDLAARVGTQAARVAATLERHDAAMTPALTRDVVASLASDPSFVCAVATRGAQTVTVPAAARCEDAGHAVIEEVTFAGVRRRPIEGAGVSQFAVEGALGLDVLGDGDAGQLSRLDPESLAFIEPDGAPS